MLSHTIDLNATFLFDLELTQHLRLITENLFKIESIYSYEMLKLPSNGSRFSVLPLLLAFNSRELFSLVYLISVTS